MHRLMLSSAALLMVASSLGGCALFGVSQTTSEKIYTDGAIVATGAIKSGKLTPNVVGDTCTVDTTDYNLLASGRSSTDGVPSGGYAPADNAHAGLQTAGQPLAPGQCSTPPPKSP